MSGPRVDQSGSSKPVEVLIVAPRAMRIAIEAELKRWPRPRFRITAFSRRAEATDYVFAAVSPAPDLAILQTSPTEDARDILPHLLTATWPDCPAILIHPADAPPEPLPSEAGVDLLEEPFEMAELAAAIAELLCASQWGASQPRASRALKALATRMVEERIAALRVDQIRIIEMIQHREERRRGREPLRGRRRDLFLAQGAHRIDLGRS